jgi:hypothetical protein
LRILFQSGTREEPDDDSTREAQAKRRGLSRLFAIAPALIGGILLALLVVPADTRRVTVPTPVLPADNLPDIDHLSGDEIRKLIVKALSRLSEQQGIDSGISPESVDQASLNPQCARRGVDNIRRLLPSAKQLTIEALRGATAAYSLEPAAWPRVSRLIHRVRKIVRSQDLEGMAAIRDDRLSEILIDPEYAPYLSSDDEAVFVLAHELTHVAARSGKLGRFIEAVASNARRDGHVEATADQKEDLACDYVGELVLKRFIAMNPTSESTPVRVARVFGYESPSERFARAWQDFCASYNGDPGDNEHLNQYQTIRALIALDPELRSLVPIRSEDNKPTPASPDK